MADVSVNRAWRLRRRPVGAVVPGDLELVSEPVAPLRDGQALVRTLVLSVEAASRIWMGHQRAFMPPVGLGEVMRGVGVGVGANAGCVTADKGVGVGSAGRSGRTTTGAGATGLPASGGVAGATSSGDVVGGMICGSG